MRGSRSWIVGSRSSVWSFTTKTGPGKLTDTTCPTAPLSAKAGVGWADAFQKRLDGGAANASGLALAAEGDVLGHGQIWIQGGVLEHDADAAGLGRDSATGRRDRLSVDADAAAVDRSSPATRRSRALLPDPDAPCRPRMRPRLSVRLAAFTATFGP